MSNLIDKITFEVGPPVEGNPKLKTFTYMVKLYYLEQHIGTVRLTAHKSYIPVFITINATLTGAFARYLSLEASDIIKLVRHFIMRGGLGFNVSKVITGYD